MGGQLDLFGAPPETVTAAVDADERSLAERLPSWIRFGTSSWSFPGWTRVWGGTPSAEALAKNGLRAYATHPLFRTVGLDRSYYAPLRDEDLAGYREQLDAAENETKGRPRFRVVSKVWEEITTAVFPNHPRYGARAGETNPNFLDAVRFVDEVLGPYQRQFEKYAGPFLFELTPMPRGTFDGRVLARRIDTFLSRIAAAPGASAFRWSFELRNEELLGPSWFDVLASHGAAHVFNFWTAMPSLRVQLARPRAMSTRFVVTRLMLPPYSRYELKMSEFAPFDRLAEVQPEMRDDVLYLLRAAAEMACDEAFVIANNKAEGSSPLTVRALAERAVKELVRTT